MAVPLFHSRLPVAPSYACTTAAAPRPVALDGAPVARVNTTPFTIRGVPGAGKLCDTHAGSTDGLDPLPDSFNAITAPLDTAPLVVGSPAPSPPRTGISSHVVATDGDAAPPGRVCDGVTADCCHSASAAPLTAAPFPSKGFDAKSGVVWFAPPREAPSRRITRPSLVAAAITCFPL